MKKKVFALAILLLLVCSLSLPAIASFDSQAARHCVVVVYTGIEWQNGTQDPMGTGSGFFVGNPGQDPSYLVTNYHVIEGFLDYGAGELIYTDGEDYYSANNGSRMPARAKIRVYYDSNDYEEAYVVDYNEHKDIAVLKLAAPTGKRAALAIDVPSESMVGSVPIHAIGYPGLAENIYAGSTTSWKESDSTVTSGTISRLFVTSGTGVASIQVDLEFKPGNSGGPLVTDDNVVIGVTTYVVGATGDATNYAIHYAISAEEVIPILDRNGVSHTARLSGGGGGGGDDPAPVPTPEPTPEPKPGFPMWAIIAIAGGVVVIAVVVILIVALGKKKKPVQQPIQQPMQQPIQQPMQQPVGVAAGYQPPVQRAPMRQGYVRSLSPQHRGSRVPVSPQQPVYIGRGQDCAVVYQSNTPGVSGRHCSLSFDPGSGDFLLTDLSSTYGTYLQNGQKLMPNTPYHIHSGDQFYLGERANMLQVNVE